MFAQDFFAGAMTVAGLGQGFMSSQAPALTKEVYGKSEDKTPYSLYLTRLSGTAVLSMGVMAFSLFVMNQDPKKAIGWGSVPWLWEKGHTLLNKVPQECGQPATPSVVWAIVTIVSIHACFSGAEYGNSFLLGTFGLLFANMVLGLVAPDTTAKLYGVDPATVDKVRYQLRLFAGYIFC